MRLLLIVFYLKAVAGCSRDGQLILLLHQVLPEVLVNHENIVEDLVSVIVTLRELEFPGDVILDCFVQIQGFLIEKILVGAVGRVSSKVYLLSRRCWINQISKR